MRKLKKSKNNCKNDSPHVCPLSIVHSISFVSFLVSGLFLLKSLQALLNLLVCSVQLIFSILLHIHIAKASSSFISTYLVAHVCGPYRKTLHSIGFYRPFLLIPV